MATYRIDFDPLKRMNTRVRAEEMVVVMNGVARFSQ